VFGRRRKRDDELRKIRAELTADVHARAVLADAIARIESTLASERHKSEQIELSTQASVEHLRYAFHDHTTELSRAVEQVARMCALLAERVEAERVERRALVDAMRIVAQQHSLPSAPAAPVPPRVLGGSFYAEERDDIEVVTDERTASDAPEHGTGTVDVVETPAAPASDLAERLAHWTSS
jgi:hypothetical protein